MACGQFRFPLHAQGAVGALPGNGAVMGAARAAESPAFPPHMHRLGAIAHRSSTCLCTDSREAVLLPGWQVPADRRSSTCVPGQYAGRENPAWACGLPVILEHMIEKRPEAAGAACIRGRCPRGSSWGRRCAAGTCRRGSPRPSPGRRRCGAGRRGWPAGTGSGPVSSRSPRAVRRACQLANGCCRTRSANFGVLAAV